MPAAVKLREDFSASSFGLRLALISLGLLKTSNPFGLTKGLIIASVMRVIHRCDDTAMR
jgi:hypothetical protein